MEYELYCIGDDETSSIDVSAVEKIEVRNGKLYVVCGDESFYTNEIYIEEK